jgi:hypothetical protein
MGLTAALAAATGVGLHEWEAKAKGATRKFELILTPTAPEPSTRIMLGTGALLLAANAIRRKVSAGRRGSAVAA